MIRHTNSCREEHHTVSMDCEVIGRSEKQDFSLNFAPVTSKIYSDLAGIDPDYAADAVLHIYYVYQENQGRCLPKEGMAAWG